MTYYVTLTTAAEEDMDIVLEWLAKQSAAGAHRWLLALEKALEQLEHSAASFGAASERKVFGDNVYEHYFATTKGRRYRLVYEIVGNRVNVLRIRAPGQSPLRE